MEGKRACDEGVEGEAKRAKIGYEVVLGGERYINLEQHVRTPPFSSYFKKHCGKSVKQLIIREQLDEEVVYVSKTNVKNGMLDVRPKYKPATDLRLAKKCGKMQDFIDRILGAADPPAPPVITDKDIRFFEDALQTEHAVEMRGERTLRGIYFKLDDVGMAIGSKSLRADIQRKTTTPEEGEDYVWFLVDHKRVLFVTFVGLMRVIMRSNLPSAKPLCLWVCEKVFCIGFGTEEQKDALGRTLLTKETINLITSRCANKVACIYLLETTHPSPDTDNKVYKFGFSKNVGRRIGELTSKYGRKAAIDTLVILPLELVSTAEKELKKTLGGVYAYQHDGDTELLLLSDSSRTSVRDQMRVIGETFYGETLAPHQLQMLAKDAAIVKRDHALELAEKAQALIVAERGKVILEMKIQTHARRIKELEDQLSRQDECQAP
ncbi:hypothetical protein DVH05_004869 [Phytophthora capsici]|nr:hypothetical protein DVH05_006647 [Phytophthora capsici]KAG1704840.1 hypothetical protein DVH05_004869 [Phytophthora capsici]